MPDSSGKVDDPCEECRSRHLKCDDSRPKCSQCERNGAKCRRTKNQAKFRHGSSAKYDKNLPKDQVWLNLSRNAKIQIVDQTPELENIYTSDDVTVEPPRSHAADVATGSTNENAAPFHSPTHTESTHLSPIVRSTTTELNGVELSSPNAVHLPSFDNAGPPNKRLRTEGSPLNQSSGIPIQGLLEGNDFFRPTISSPAQHFHFMNPLSSPTETNETTRIEAEYRRLADTEAAAIPDLPFLSPERWKRDFRWPNQYTTQQCMCLFRYYIKYLGPWLDVGDPMRYFTTVVPHRARRCPPLLNAIFTAAARHLRYRHELNNQENNISFEGYDLPELNEISTIKYYQATTAYLSVLAGNPKHVVDHDLLAATVISRFYEELDSYIRGDPDDFISRPFQLFVAGQARPATDAQVSDDLPFHTPGVFASQREQIEPYLKSYQHASFRVALRQECQSALLSRSELRLPLQAWSLLNGFDDADDSTWADRHLYHHAKVLQFCFQQHSTSRSKLEEYQSLLSWQSLWEEMRPMGFSPFMKQEANPAKGIMFPTSWYVDEVNALGMIYFYFSRLLLKAHNPSVEKMGPGHVSARRKLEREIRHDLIQLCGIAMSTSPAQPVLVQAFHAIVMFGDYVSDAREQRALLGILSELEDVHAWPTRATAEMLKREWEWSDM